MEHDQRAYKRKKVGTPATVDTSIFGQARHLTRNPLDRTSIMIRSEGPRKEGAWRISYCQHIDFLFRTICPSSLGLSLLCNYFLFFATTYFLHNYSSHSSHSSPTLFTTMADPLDANSLARSAAANTHGQRRERELHWTANLDPHIPG